MTVPALEPHAVGILEALATTTIPVDLGKRPEGAGWQAEPGTSPFHAYLVLHSVAGSLYDGPIADPDADLDGFWQVTAVAANATGCLIAADAARLALLTYPIAVTDRSVVRARPLAGGGARRDDSTEPQVWISTEVYSITTTPA